MLYIPKIPSRLIRNIPDFPKKGIVFKDLTPLIANGKAMGKLIEEIAVSCKGADKVVGIEARGFIFGAMLAQRLGIGFIPIRKKGKLPYKSISEKCTLEYGKDELEIHRDALRKGETVVLVDDVLATGGTLLAAARLIRRLKAKIAKIVVILEIKELGGRERLKARVGKELRMLKEK